MLLLECYSSHDIMDRYYGNATVKGAQVPMNFAFIGLNNQSTAHEYAQMIADEMKLVDKPGRTANWVVRIWTHICYL